MKRLSQAQLFHILHVAHLVQSFSNCEGWMVGESTPMPGECTLLGDLAITLGLSCCDPAGLLEALLAPERAKTLPGLLAT